MIPSYSILVAIMKQLFLEKRLPILLSVIANDRMESVELKPHPEGLACEILGAPNQALKKQIIHFIQNYLEGKPTQLPPLDWKKTTPFTRSVLQRVSQLAPGETCSYSDIAHLMGIPKGARAIGGACGRNPFVFFVPCHRVISLGGMGGFSCGLTYKKELLAFENK